MHALLGGTARIGVTGRRSGDELIDLEIEFFGGCCRVEENFLVAVLASALDGFVAATTAYDAEREHFQERQKAEVAEKAEVLLPCGAFCQNCKGPFELVTMTSGEGLQKSSSRVRDWWGSCSGSLPCRL